ncbi:MAG: hypothetical protein K9M02_14110 [Thiohalocapsa sp.]|nr:hypothetical protein [Thiohalocapsa sp.]
MRNQPQRAEPLAALPHDVWLLPEGDRREIIRDTLRVAMGAPARNVHPMARRLDVAGARGEDLAMFARGFRGDEGAPGPLPQAVLDDPAVAKLHRDVARRANNQTTTRRAAWSSADLIDAAQFAAVELLNATSAQTPEHEAVLYKFPLSDFRTATAPRIEAGDLSDKSEHNQIAPFAMTMLGERVTLDTKAARATFTRESVINGEWGLLGAMVRELDAARYRSERDAFIAMLTANGGAGPTLYDGLAMFAADRGNIGNGPGSTTEVIGNAGERLRQMKTMHGANLQLRGKVLMIPAWLEYNVTLLELADRAGLTIFADSRLESGYLLPDPNIRPVFGLGLLDGRRHNEVQIKAVSNPDGWGLRIIHDAVIAPLSTHAVRIDFS